MLLKRATALNNVPFVLRRAADGTPVGRWPTAGTVTLQWNDTTTAPVAYSATAAALTAALATLSSGNLTASGGPWPTTAVDVEFAGELAGQPQPLLTLAAHDLSGGLGNHLVVERVRPGGSSWTDRQDKILGQSGATGGTFSLYIEQGGNSYTIADIPYDVDTQLLQQLVEAQCPVATVIAGGGDLPNGGEMIMDWRGPFAGSEAPTMVSLTSAVQDAQYSLTNSNSPQSSSVNELQRLRIANAWPVCCYVIDGVASALAGTYTCVDADAGLWCLANVPPAATAGNLGMLLLSADACRSVSLPFRTTQLDLDSTTVKATDAAGHALATLTAVNAITTNTTRGRPVVPNQIFRPAVGSVSYEFDLNLYTLQGQMETPDAAPTVHARNAAGQSRDVCLVSTTMTLLDVGRYRCLFQVAAGDPVEEVLLDFRWVVRGQSFTVSDHTFLCDVYATDFTNADRSKLEEIHTRLPAGGLVDAGNVQTSCEAALASYGAPTQAHLADRTLPAAEYAQALQQQSLTPAEREAVADAVLGRSVEHVEAGAGPHSLCYSVLLMSAADRTAHAGFVTVYRTDGVTEFCRKALDTAPNVPAVVKVQ